MYRPSCTVCRYNNQELLTVCHSQTTADAWLCYYIIDHWYAAKPMSDPRVARSMAHTAQASYPTTCLNCIPQYVQRLTYSFIGCI